MTSFAQEKEAVSAILSGIDRYNPENLSVLENYVAIQVKENAYDCEANLAVLKLYQFVPNLFQTDIAAQILLKAMTNLPHTDFALCKYLIDYTKLEEMPLESVVNLGNLLEQCEFKQFWQEMQRCKDMVSNVNGFEDSIRQYICHVVKITYQKISKSFFLELVNLPDVSELSKFLEANGFQEQKDNTILVANHEENVKSKNIKEKVTFDGIALISSTFRPAKFGA